MDETEEELIKRVGRAMFGDNIAFTPQVMDLIKPLFRKYLDDMDNDRMNARMHSTGDQRPEQVA